MSPLPSSFLDHLRAEGYHPRSNKHSNALGRALVEDLLVICPELAAKARLGEVVFDLNFDLRVKTATWNVDVVLGRPAESDASSSGAILRAPPSTVEIAIEIKSVMTEHRKAVKNRKRDLEAHHEHVHNYDSRAIAGGVIVVNGSPQFQSPLRTNMTTHGRGDRESMVALVAHCVSEIRNIAERAGPAGEGLDAKCALVVNMDNVHLAQTSFETRQPAPQVGDPLHYDAFMQRLCGQYLDRFIT